MIRGSAIAVSLNKAANFFYVTVLLYLLAYLSTVTTVLTYILCGMLHCLCIDASGSKNGTDLFPCKEQEIKAGLVFEVYFCCSIFPFVDECLILLH